MKFPFIRLNLLILYVTTSFTEIEYLSSIKPWVGPERVCTIKTQDLKVVKLSINDQRCHPFD